MNDYLIVNTSTLDDVDQTFKKKKPNNSPPNTYVADAELEILRRSIPFLRRHRHWEWWSCPEQ